MTAAPIGPPLGDDWTTDDLDAFPEDGVRRELLDGALLVYPGLTNVHQVIVMRLAVALEESCPPTLLVTPAIEMRIDQRNSFIPDVVVTTDDAARHPTRFFAPHEVVLAVEIVSPTSVSMDRITKPALYAAAGIPYYWRIETDGGISVSTYKIDPESEMYRPFGMFEVEIDAVEPWEIKIPISRLTPRYL